METGAKINRGEKMTQQELADKVGVSQAFISQMLNGERRPKLATAKKLSKAVPGTDPLFWMEATPRQMNKTITAAGKEAA